MDGDYAYQMEVDRFVQIHKELDMYAKHKSVETLAHTLREVSVGRIVRTMREVREVTRKEELYGGW